jgi:hypothetical protein
MSWLRIARPDIAPAVVHEVLRSPGQPLPRSIRGQMERRFRHDFSAVRVHADASADESARAVQARAYTVGNHVVFASGGYRPESVAGASLLSHELAHVVQQDVPRADGGNSGDLRIGAPNHPAERQAASVSASTSAVPQQGAMRSSHPVLQRTETLGTRVTEPKGAAAPFKSVRGTFDGATFTLIGDGKPIVSAAAQSGHPNRVTAADAKLCKGSPDDSYLNNVRYVGIKDKGAIPEGEFTFRHSEMVTFTAVEDAKMALASPGSYSDPAGLDLHGDWGAARVALRPVKVLPSRFGGNTAARGGFYLHGGVMTGSSGCIDVGNAAVTTVVHRLSGYTKPVPVTVRYTVAAPTTSAFERAAGRFMYPGKDTSLMGRIGSVLGGGTE